MDKFRTTGGPAGRFPGISRGFSFRAEQNFVNEPADMAEVGKILIAQVKTSQVNPYSNTRLPFTLHLADKMAKALIRDAIPPDYSGDGFPAFERVSTHKGSVKAQALGTHVLVYDHKGSR